MESFESFKKGDPSINIRIYQFSPRKDVWFNLEFIVDGLKNTQDALILLPELFLSDYIDYQIILKEDLQYTLRDLLTLSASNKLAFVRSLPIQEPNNLYNRCLYINAGSIVGCYNKIRLFGQEKTTMTKGIEPIGLFKYRDITFATQICLDVIDPLVLSTIAKETNVDFLLIPGSFSLDHLLIIAKARALENQLISIIANRSRTKGASIEYLGRSAFFFPDGREKYFNSDEEALRIFSIDYDCLSLIRAKRQHLLFS